MKLNNRGGGGNVFSDFNCMYDFGCDCSNNY